MAHGLKSVCVPIATSVVAMVALGGYWYARNWWNTGLPLFPLSITGAPCVWTEMRPDWQSSNLLGSIRVEVLVGLLRAGLTQAGPLTILLSVVGSIAALWHCIYQLWSRIRSTRSDATNDSLETSHRGLGAKLTQSTFIPTLNKVYLLTLGCIAIFLITPNTIETDLGTMNMLLIEYHPVRFAGPLLWLAPFAAMASIRLFSRRARIASYLFLAIAAEFQFALQFMAMFNLRKIPTILGIYYWWPAVRHPAIVSTIGLTVCCFLFAALLWRLAQFPRIRRGISITLFICMMGWLSHRYSDHWHANFGKHYSQVLGTNAFQYMTQHRDRSDSTCVLMDRYYPLIGSRREFIVKRPLYVPDSQSLSQILSKDHYQYVVIQIRAEGMSDRYRGSAKWLRNTRSSYKTQFRDTAIIVRERSTKQVRRQN